MVSAIINIATIRKEGRIMFAKSSNDENKNKSEIDKLLESENGKLALKNAYFTESEAKVWGVDMLAILLSNDGIKAFEKNILTVYLIEQIQSRFNHSNDFLKDIVSDEGRAIIQSTPGLLSHLIFEDNSNTKFLEKYDALLVISRGSPEDRENYFRSLIAEERNKNSMRK
jgi:hypothetical protein